MIGKLHIALILVSTAFAALILLLIIKRWARPKTPTDAERAQNFQNGVARLHQVSPHHHQVHRDESKNTNHHLFGRGKPAFSWADHPSLVTDAVENGWSRFAFTAFMSTPSVKSPMSLLGACGGADHGDENSVEIGWEVCEGSADYMQKIRLNPKVKRSSSCSWAMTAGVVVRSSLPLPGPNLGNSSFPQESYFEITIVSYEFGCREKKGRGEGDKIKLIESDFNGGELLCDRERRSRTNEEVVMVCVGLTGGNPLPFRIPGTFPPSIGFNSTGSVYLDGTKLTSDSEKNDWGRTDKVIGCGFSPSQKKVFFTVDSQIVQEIHCKTQDFCSPLYPTLAANTDVVVLVNLGQSPFRFTPANLQRTPNPCFIGPMATSPAIGYEDSRELFSMGRIDSQWLQRSATRSNNNTVNSIKAMEEYDQESEGDLFEIVLDSIGRSPYPNSK